MAENKVRFLRGTTAEYADAIKDDDTFYYTTDDGKLYIGDKEISGNGNIMIDSEMSDTSENPVQNKVIKAALDEKADKAIATTTADGLMSAADKAKLDGISDSGGGGGGNTLEIKTLTSENRFLDLTQLPQNGMILSIEPNYGTSTSDSSIVYGVNTTNLFCPLVHSGIEDNNSNFGGATTYAGYKNNTLGVSKGIINSNTISVSGTATETAGYISHYTADTKYNLRTMLGYFLPVGEVTIDLDIPYIGTDSATPKFYVNNKLYNITDFPMTLTITSSSNSYIFHHQVSGEYYNFRVSFYVYKPNYDKNNLTSSSAFENDTTFYQYTQKTMTYASTCSDLFNNFIRSKFYLTKDKTYTEDKTGAVYYTPGIRSGYIDICKYAFLYNNNHDFTIQYVEDRNSVIYDNKPIGLSYTVTSIVDFDIHSFVLIKAPYQQATKISSIQFLVAHTSSDSFTGEYIDSYVGNNSYECSVSKHPEGVLIISQNGYNKYYKFKVVFESE